MSEQSFLQLLVERAQNVVLLQRMGNTFKATRERHAIYRDIDFYCKNDGAAIAMYEKIMLYYLEERPSFVPNLRKKTTRTTQKRKAYMR
jgi:hypothetical protein